MNTLYEYIIEGIVGHTLNNVRSVHLSRVIKYISR